MTAYRLYQLGFTGLATVDTGVDDQETLLPHHKCDQRQMSAVIIQLSRSKMIAQLRTAPHSPRGALRSAKQQLVAVAARLALDMSEFGVPRVCRVATARTSSKRCC